jgi:type I restriction enzyme R subunit
MLDTGIDVPEIVNLVFARPVKSPVKFWQMLGRGTRLCKNLLGPGQHKTHFQVFDHWGVVEYHGLVQREVTISQSKSLMQRLFETRLELAKTSLQHAESDFFDSLAHWLHTAINSLNDNTLAVRNNWKLKRQMGDLDTLRQFHANTVILLQNEIAPLMQWLDVRGHSDAYQWDLLVSQIQQHKLNKSAGFADGVGEGIKQLWQLQMNLNQVKAKAHIIKPCRELAWWQSATVQDMEQMRLELRSIMQHRDKGTGPTIAPPVIDITDGDEVREQQGSYLTAVDMASYRIKVEQALKALFEHSPVLQKIRNGVAVTKMELDQLNALIHTQHPDVDLKILKDFYATAAPMEQILRSIVGMDVDAVNRRFADFIQLYPSLSARQVQFLGLLKRQIAQSGSIEINSLYEMPFAAIGEPDTLFTNAQQMDDLLAIVESFCRQPAVDTSLT